MFWVTHYPMISQTESGRVGYREIYQVVGRVREPAGHCPQLLRIYEVVLSYRFEETQF